MDPEEGTVCTRCLERGEECTPGGGTTRACAQCRQVKGKCSLVRKADPAPSTPTKARKRPRVGEAGSTRAAEVREKGAEATDGEVSWGERVCEGIATLSGSLDGLTAMIERQTLLLGRLAGMMEEEADHRRWRRKMEGEPVRPPAIIEGVGDEEEVREEVEEGVGNEGENEEDDE